MASSIFVVVVVKTNERSVRKHTEMQFADFGNHKDKLILLINNSSALKCESKLGNTVV